MVSYQLTCHPTAQRELTQLPSDARDRLTSILQEVAEQREPSSHQRARHLEGQPGLFRVRSGDYRAICTLDKPNLKVVKIGERAGVYDDVDDLRENRLATA